MSEANEGAADNDIRNDIAAAAKTVEAAGAEPAPTTATQTALPLETDAAPTGQRDEKGRFKPTKAGTPHAPSKQPTTEADAQVPEAQNETEAPAATAPTAVQPPAAWKDRRKPIWESMTPAAQAEVRAREAEINTYLAKNGPLLKTAKALDETIRPYRPLMGDAQPQQVIGNLLETAKVLQAGTREQRAQVVANILQGYKISPDDVADVLEGKALASRPEAAPAQPPQQEFRDKRFDMLVVAAQQQAQQRNQQTIDDFVKGLGQDSAFLTDYPFPEGWPTRTVQEMMASLLDSWGGGKTKEDLQRAYEVAVQANPEVQKILAQRAEKKRREKTNAEAQASRSAASSVRHEPAAPAGMSEADDTFATVRQVAAEMARR